MPNTVSINRNLIDLEYAVRGPLAIRAAELVKQGRDIILCNLGNPQALGQKPITFYRQTLSLLEYPEAIINERKKGNLISLTGQKNLSAFNYKVGSDPSSAAFLIILTLLTPGAKSIIPGVICNNTRIKYIQILKKMNSYPNSHKKNKRGRY